MSVQIVIALIDLVVVTVLIVRRVEVRLVLLAAAVPLFAVSGGLKAMLTKLVAEMANPGTVVPICTALGFAYVLRITECDQHLIRLLLRPLQHVRWLLIPGGISAGYLVNTTIVSQTGTAAVLGPILIPLLRAGGIPPATAGAILLLGSSMGGELFNPGAVEMRKLAELTGLSGPEVVARSTAQNLLACGTALLVVLGTVAIPRQAQAGSRRREAEAETEPAGGSVDFAINPIKAVVPVLPLVLLFTDSSLGAFSPLRALEGPAKILAAMLIGIVLAGLTSPRVGGQLATAFFEGAGYAYTHRHLADRGGFDLCRGNQSQRPDRVDRQGARGLAERRRWPSAPSPPGRSRWSRAPASRRRSRSWSSSCRSRRRCIWIRFASARSPRSARISDGR